MTKRKPIHSHDNVKYKQTDISTYFVKCKTPISNKMCTKDVEELVIKRRRPVRLLTSDEESEAESTVGRLECLNSSKTSINDNKEDNISISKMSESQKLPYELPVYIDSEDSDVTCCSVQQSVSKKRNTKKVAKKGPAVKTSITKNDSKSTDYSSDEDSLQSPNKIRKTEKSPKIPIEVQKKLFNNSENIQNILDRPSTSKGLHSENTLNSTIITHHKSTSNNENKTDCNPNKKENIMITSSKITVLQDVKISPVNKTNSPINTATKNKKRVIVKKSIENVSSRDDTYGKEEQKLIIKIVMYICEHNHLKTMLTRTEVEFLTEFFKIFEKQYIFLCIKLFISEQKWYNANELIKTLKLNISGREMSAMCDYLNKNKFIDIDYSMEPMDFILNHLHQKHIKEICEYFKIELTSYEKCFMIQKLIMHCKYPTGQVACKAAEQILRDKVKQKLGLCLRLNPVFYCLLNKVHLLYSFTNNFETIEDLHEFLMKIERKEIFIPQVQINKDFQVFASMDEFLVFSEAFQLKQALLQACNKRKNVRIFELCTQAYEELQRIVVVGENGRLAYLQCFTAGCKYTEALTVGTKHLVSSHFIKNRDPDKIEKWLLFLLEQNQFCQQNRGLWYDSLIVVQYFHLNKTDLGIQTLINALNDKSLLEVDLYELSDRAETIKGRSQKVCRLQKDNISSMQPKSITEFPSIEISFGRQQSSSFNSKIVQSKGKCLKKIKNEESELRLEKALNHYVHLGFANGLICKSELLITIFFVLFWDIIYDSNVQGVYISELQYVPTDLFSKEFYTNRKQWIDKRLDEINYEWLPGELECHVDNIWQHHAHEKSYINDGIIDEAKQLNDIILCIGRARLSQILKRIAEDFETYHSGIPDLFLWNVRQRKCKFVQVQEEKSKLSVKHKLWMDFLRSIGKDVEVCIICNSDRPLQLSKIKSKGPKQEKKKCLNKSLSVKQFIF